MADEPERKKVRIACRVPNGVKLRLFKPGYDDGTGSGIRATVIDGAPVTIAGSPSLATGVNSPVPPRDDTTITEVDAEFWQKWREQNKLDPLLAHGVIYDVDEAEDAG